MNENPASVARWFREENGFAEVDRIDLEAVCRHHDVRIQPAPLDGLWGAAMVQAGSAGILINSDQYPPRYRFTLGHEMGHVFLSRHYEILMGSGALLDEQISQRSPANDLEEEANTFASELLAPTGRVRTHLRAGGIDIAAAHRVADAFEVSLTSAALRIVDVSPQQVSVLRFQGDDLNWRYDGRDFPFGVPWSDWKAPAGSVTADVIANGDDQLEAEEVEPQTWFVKMEWGTYPTPLLESCIRLGGTGGYLTMLWVP